jgi:hypothetical protein
MLTQNLTVKNGVLPTNDAAEEALKASLKQAKKMVESAQNALDIYKSIHGESYSGTGQANGTGRSNARALAREMGGDTRRGITSRALSGEMGGDTNGAHV